jgi:hypothetical protein
MAIKIKSQTVKVNFEEYEGDTLTMSFAYKNPDGTLIDLTGYTAKMDICTEALATPTLTLTDTTGITLGGTPNNIVVVLTPSQTHTTLGVGNFVYDLELTDTLAQVNTLIEGSITIKQSITQ